MSQTPEFEGMLTIAGGFILLVSAVGTGLIVLVSPAWLVLLIAPPLVVLSVGAAMFLAPGRHVVWGATIVAFAAWSTFGLSSIVFVSPQWGVQSFAGGAVAVAGGALGIRWKPTGARTGEPVGRKDDLSRRTRAAATASLIGSALMLNYVLGLWSESTYDGLRSPLGVDLSPFLVGFGAVALAGSVLLLADADRRLLWSAVVVASSALSLLQIAVQPRADFWLGHRIQAVSGVALGIAGGLMVIRLRARARQLVPNERGGDDV